MKIVQSRLSVVILLLGTGGCFQYVPESGASPPTRGSPIRLQLVNPTSFELTQFTVNNITTVNGELVRRVAGDVILSSTWLETAGAVGFDGESRTLRIPDSNVAAFELKKVSWFRTGAVVLGGALGTILGFNALGSEGGGGGGGGSVSNPL